VSDASVIATAGDSVCEILGHALNGYPCHVATELQPLAREAIAAWLAGTRTPEVTLALSLAYANYNDNAMRYRLHQVFLGTANSLAF
jgi:hypothetical protein